MTIIRHSYNGFDIFQENDGYVSLTDMAKASGKLVADYLRLKETNEYIQGLSDDMGIPISSLIQTVRGKGKNQGTWAHPEIAIDFAQWCSVPFRIWANRTLKKEISQQKPLAVYAERVRSMHEDFTNIPKDHWCILHESANLLIWIESVMGYPVDRCDIVDISIGKTWANHREGKPWAIHNRIRGDYRFPKGTEVAPWTYHYDELKYFRIFLEELYKPKFLPKYLEGKYGKLVK